MRPFEARVWHIVRGIPCGSVMTYGQVAKEAESRSAAQSVGNAMRKAKEENLDVPWQRVVMARGFLSDGAPRTQADLLEKEGVSFLTDNQVDLATNQWHG